MVALITVRNINLMTMVEIGGHHVSSSYLHVHVNGINLDIHPPFPHNVLALLGPLAQNSMPFVLSLFKCGMLCV